MSSARILLLVLPSDRRVTSPAVVEAYNVVEDGGIRHGLDCRRGRAARRRTRTRLLMPRSRAAAADVAERQFRRVFLGIVEVLVVIPIARLEDLPLDHDPARPGRPAT